MNTTTCAGPGCDNPIGPDFTAYLGTDKNWYCETCRDASMEESADVILLDPVTGVSQFSQSDLFTVQRAGEQVDLPVALRYVHTDGWRGYVDVDIEGWVTLASGWTTLWPDETTRRKAAFNDFVEGLLGSDDFLPASAIVATATSNVFSLAIRVLAPDDGEQAARQWWSERINLQEVLA